MEENNAYVYRHTKLGTSEVFYIGVGTQKRFKRARTKDDRNEFWHNIVNKYGFEYEILSDNLAIEDAKELEILLIKEYGRRDLGVGTLVNLTDGGDGTFNMTLEARRKISEALKGVPKSAEARKKQSNTTKDRIFTEEHKNNLAKSREGKNNNCKKIIDTKTLVIFNSLREAAKHVGREESTFRDYLKGRLNNKTNMMYLLEYINQNPEFKYE